MSKIKLDDRVESAMNAFFEAEPDRSHFALTYTGQEAALVVEKIPFSEKAEKWTRVLREIFMFGPGTFYLFYSTLRMAFFYPTVGVNYYGFLFALFLTYAGSGSIKNIKNLAVPATVISLALAIVFISKLFPGKEIVDPYFWYSIYLLPNVLIAAKLVQGWVSEKK